MTNQRSVSATLGDARVLVTGVTGFLGKVWLTMLLERIGAAHVYVVVRKQRGESAKARFARIVDTSPAFRPLRAKHGAGLDAWLDARLTVLDGDAERPLLGVSSEIAKRVDVVVHFAGLTDFEPDPRKALATNVLGAEHAADFAALCPVPRLVHVSTTFVAGNVSGVIDESVSSMTPSGDSFCSSEEREQLMRLCAGLEDRRQRIDAVSERARKLGWPNIYTYTKALAERRLADRDDIRLTIVRPSVVECAQDYPFLGWNEGINTSGPLVWLLSSWFRKLPTRPHHRFDVVPVDRVARAMMMITARALRDEADDVYQVGTSDTNPLTFERAIDLTALGARRMHDKDGASFVERFVLRHLDAVPRDAVDPFPSLPFVRRFAQGARDALRKVDPQRLLPPAIHDEIGEKLEDKLRSVSMSFRNVDRTVARVEDMLRLYMPFIHDNDYVFRTDRVRALSAALSEEERATLDFDIATLDWRSYWLEVQVPGLEKWSLPLLRGERVPEDAPPVWRAARKSAEIGTERSVPKRPSAQGGNGRTKTHRLEGSRAAQRAPVAAERGSAEGGPS